MGLKFNCHSSLPTISYQELIDHMPSGCSPLMKIMTGMSTALAVLVWKSSQS